MEEKFPKSPSIIKGGCDGWESYYEKRENHSPRDFLVYVLSRYPLQKKHALDLGAGKLIESKFLLKKEDEGGGGFERVTAVDNNPQVEKFGENRPGLEIKSSSFSDFDFKKEQYDLINAQFSLPFYDGDDFPSFMQKIIDSLQAGGIFAGQLFGRRTDDEWGPYVSKVTLHTEEEIRKIFQDLRILEIEEKEWDKVMDSGRIKHWHVFNIIARK